MKRKYRFLALAAAVGMLCINSGHVMAATGLSEAEQTILERLSEGVEMNGMVVRPPAAYLNQAENELMKNEVDLTKEQAIIINRKIDEASELVRNASLEDIVHFKDSDTAKKLIKLVEETASMMNYTVSIDIADGTFNVLNSDGNYVFMAKKVINQTGFPMTPAIIIGISFVSLLTAGAVIAGKMKLYVKIRKV